MGKVLNGDIADCAELNPKKKRFFHYTKSMNASKIFGNKQMRLSPFEKMNDKNDYRDNSFVVCFSYQENENIPLWHLYAGVHGDGIRISFTSKTMKKIQSSGFYDNNGKNIKCTGITLRHVLYYENHETSDKNYRGLYKIKINDKVFYVSKNQLEQYKKNNPGMFKLMEWEYEKEIRLVVDVNPKDYQRLNTSGIFFTIEKFRNGITVRKGPNAKNWNDKIFDDVRLYFDGLKNVKTNDSKLSGTISMRLCKDCTFNEFNVRKQLR